MTKLKDCIECAPSFDVWDRDLSSRYPFTRRSAKRQLKNIRRVHGIYEYHSYSHDFDRALHVKGCSQRVLIHKGGKP